VEKGNLGKNVKCSFKTLSKSFLYQSPKKQNTNILVNYDLRLPEALDLLCTRTNKTFEHNPKANQKYLS